MSTVPYPATTFQKDGVSETATTWAEHHQYVYDGWKAIGLTPDLSRELSPISRAELGNFENDPDVIAFRNALHALVTRTTNPAAGQWMADAIPQLQAAATTALAGTLAARDQTLTAKQAAETAATYIQSLIINDLGTSDGQAAALIATKGSATEQALAATIDTAQAGLGFVECAHVETFPATGTPVPVESIDGVLYGAVGATLSSANSPSGPWAALQTLPGSGVINGLRPTGDGEVIASRVMEGLWKSSGWATNPATATWTQVLVTNGQVAPFTWDVDPVSGWVTATVYVSGADMSASRYVWLSKARGAAGSFNVIFDLALQHPGLAMISSHMHHAVIDKHSPDPMNPRVWISYHKTPSDPTEATDKLQRQMYSDGPGTSHATTPWTVYSHEGVSADHPVIGISTPYGMVFDTDTAPVALKIVPRDKPLDTIHRRTLITLRRDIAMHGWAGRAVHGTNGAVHVGFRSSVAGQPGSIVSTNGQVASEVALIPAATGADMPDFLNLTVHKGLLVGRVRQTASAPTVDQIVVADEPRRGAPSYATDNSGGIFGGVADPTGVASGLGSWAGPWSVAKGMFAWAAMRAVAVGRAAKALVDLSTTVGDQSEAAEQATNVGALGKATGYQSANIGQGGEASGARSGNFGRNGKALHAGSFNWGNSGETTGDNQHQFGERHFESTRVSSLPAPGTGKGRWAFRSVTIGGVPKTQLAVRTESGVVIPVATQDCESAGAVRTGAAVLVAGTITVEDASVTANTRIRLTSQRTLGTPGAVYVSARAVGASFTITSTSAADTSTIYWEILQY